MRHRRCYRVGLVDYDCEILTRYHLWLTENYGDDALSRKERVKIKRVRDMNMIFYSSIKDRILTAQKEAVDESAGLYWRLGEKGYSCVSIEKVWVTAFGKKEKVSTLVPLDEIQVDAKLNFVEEPVEILKREFKKLKRSRIAIVKVRWNSKRDPEFMWEREDQMKLKYRHLFSDVSS
ncbi:hypothetical protein Tco_0070816 [Tanacetum coccineum]